MRRCCYLIVLGLVVGLASVSHGDKGISKQVATLPTTVPNFTALDDRAALEAVDAIVVNHRALERELTSQLDAEKTPANRKVLLIYALGQLRSVWAVSSLVKIVDFKAPFTGPKDDIARWGPYPAVDALTAIGNPAVQRIVDVLPTEKSMLRIRLMLTVIWQVEGNKPGQAWLESALAAAKEDSVKESLRNALKTYQTLASGLGK